MRSKAALPALLMAAALSACGGSGGGGETAIATGSNVDVAFPVTPSGQPGAPVATGDTAADGFAWFNYRRSQIGLAPLARNAQIDAAAAGHSNYLRLNNTVSHDQVSGNPGFTGVAVGNRLSAAGYALTRPSAYGEVISAARDSSGFFHAEELITAIYHRFLVFEPVFREMGVGAATTSNYTYFTTDFATSNGYGAGVARGSVAVYPASGQTMVPVNFMSDSESPDPVPSLNEVGYPISVHANISSVLKVTSFTVRPRGGSDLAVRLLASDVDTHTRQSAAAIIPLSRLTSGTTYDVAFAGTVDSVAVTRSWSFTTQ
ncbi:CAP domain-containing protein [Pseudoduganella sp. SL102]|uniref:CAP domain-containing protein n=1 Tax=Pseudoduganella sp. SL102 TaxID=2995154 RepID=UPI00248B9390|nr:CAP domain-containing protein [Pseudoduganella sp. SL102]WBS02739.1 CAP domain-containing protein [Pseudoduganella sp. SL102]